MEARGCSLEQDRYNRKLGTVYKATSATGNKDTAMMKYTLQLYTQVVQSTEISCLLGIWGMLMLWHAQKFWQIIPNIKF